MALKSFLMKKLDNESRIKLLLHTFCVLNIKTQYKVKFLTIRASLLLHLKSEGFRNTSASFTCACTR